MTKDPVEIQPAPASPKDADTADPPEISTEQLAKLVLEIGPLLVFFATNWYADIFWGTGAFMVATVIALTVSLVKYGRIPLMPLVTGVFVMVFGGLTLWAQDDDIIKLKPTIVNGLFASILFVGLAFGRSLLKYIFGEIFKLNDDGWRLLTIRWALFFVFLAVLNEVVRTNFSTDFWVGFKVFGLMPITFVFALAQLGLIQKHEQK